MPRFLIFFCCLFSSVAAAQTLTISATVVDKETREPLAFASVGIKDKPVGTITNLQGEVDFHVAPEYRNDIVVISVMGYRSFESPVWALLENPRQVIELDKTIFLLQEVVVKDSLSGGDVLRIALDRVDQNYPSSPYMMDGFYRDIKKVGGTYISLLEAATKIYDEDYKAPRNREKLRERVALMEVRRSLGYRNKFTSYFDETNLLEELLLQNFIKYRRFPEEEIFYDSMRRERDSYYNGHEIFSLGLRGDHDYHIKIFVDKETFGIIHIEFMYARVTDVDKRRGMQSRQVYEKSTIDFRQFNGKLYLNYISSESKVNWYDLRTNTLKFETELFQQLLINTVETDSVERIGTTEKMKSYGLQYQDLPYNKKFWERYNVIKESPLDKKIIEDLEKFGPLEKQFQDNR